jgi:hypothetical protein
MALDGIFDHIQGFFNAITLRRTSQKLRTIDPIPPILKVWMEDDFKFSL